MRRVSPLLAIAGGLVGLLAALAILAPVAAPYDPLAQSVLARLKGPSAAHWLGTDQFGRDLLSRIIHGLRASLGISAAAVLAALLAGGTLGLLAAFYRGWTERILMRLMDVVFAFPVMLLAIGVIAMLGPGPMPTAIAIAVVYTPIFARLIRGPALVLSESDFVMSARAIGASDARIILLHILPNLASVVIVQTSLLLSAAILVEASLSFLGLGTQPPSPSLGTMLAEGRNFLMLSPWSAIFSGLAILILSFSLNLLGDVLRDRLDPRAQGRRVRIRAAREADVAALSAVAAASYRAAFLSILGQDGLAQRAEPFFVARFGSEWPTLRLAEQEGRILGFHQVREGRLDMLFLAPEAIGQGLGAGLLADAEAQGAVALECFRDNHAARRFYERHGWRFDQALEREFAGAVRAFVTYRKER